MRNWVLFFTSFLLLGYGLHAGPEVTESLVAGFYTDVSILPKTEESDVQQLSYQEVLQETRRWIDTNMLDAEEGNLRDIAIEIKMSCPMSEELDRYLKSVPKDQSVNFEDWKTSFIENMKQLIHLVESGKIHSSYWSVNASDGKP